MIPTVREVLALPALAAGEPALIAGSAFVDRAVRWVHVTEATDLAGLLSGGELVMTTGLALTSPREQAEIYLRQLAELGVAALVVELGTHLQLLPDWVGVVAEELPLTLVVLRRRTRFVEVTEHVHRLIVADQYEELRFAQATHEVFTSLNIGRATPTDIVTKAADMLAAPVVLEDLNHHVVAFAAVDAATTELLHGWGERSRRQEGGSQGSSGWSAVPVGAGAQRWGRLVLPTIPGDPARSRMVLERAAQSLQLQRMVEQDRDALVMQALGGLIEDLTTGRLTDEAEAMARASALGLLGNARYVPLVICSARRPGDDALAQGAVDRRLLTAVRQAVSASGLSAIAVIRREGTVAVVLSCPYATAVEGALLAVCAGVESRLAGRSSGTDWAAGAAAATPGLVAAAGGLAEAEHVAAVGATMARPQRLFRSTDVRLRGLITLLRSDHRVQAFAETELGRLLDHDARTGEGLVSVLRAYLAAEGSKAEAARTAQLSRPTLYSRLGAIERILGVSIDTVESRTSLHAALMVVDTRAY